MSKEQLLNNNLCHEMNLKQGKIRQLYHYSSKEIEIIRSNILNLSINKLKDIL